MEEDIPPKAGDPMLKDHAQSNGLDIKEPPMSQKDIDAMKRNINKNIFIINFAFFLMFCAFVGLSIIQSSVVGVIGTVGLGVNFGASIFSCLILSPVIIRLIGCKRTMLVCFIGFTIWMAANYYPRWGTVIPAAAINGIANGPIWTGQATYFTIQGFRYAAVSGENDDAVIARFFGLFFCFLLFGRSINNIYPLKLITAPT